MLAGLTAGAIAAVIAALVSLPLHSPLDSAFNSATVVVVALVVGVISGFLWTRFSDRMLWFLGALAGLFVIALVIAFVGNTQLDRMVSFMVPLAAIVVVVCAVLTPLLASFFLKPALGLLKWSPLVSVVIALVVGFALVTQGDAESGELALPPPPTAAATPSAPIPTATTAPPTATTAAVPSTAEATTPVTRSAATPVPAEPTPEPPPTAVSAAGGEPGRQFIVGEGSKINFEVEEELGRAPIRFNAVITGEGLTGVANLDGQPSVVTLDLHSLESDQQFRDQYIRSRLFRDTPEAVVTVDQLPDLPQTFFDGVETSGELTGSLKIGETVTPLVFDVTARNDGNVINILALTTITWEQLGLPKPTARPVVYLADEVAVQVLLIATAP